MYSVNNTNFVNKGKVLDKTYFIDIDGFLMASKNKVFKIEDNEVKGIKVVNKTLANPLVSRKVFQKYNRLISYLTELLVEDDDDGETCREALNQIEKFRLEIKNKYREFLKQQELEKMSKQLMLLKKEANRKLMEIQNSYLEYQNQSNRSK